MLRMPMSYPHTQERYEADVKRATEYVARHLAPRTYAGPKWVVTLFEPTLSRRSYYVVGGLDRLTAATRGIALAAEAGPSYVFEQVEVLTDA